MAIAAVIWRGLALQWIITTKNGDEESLGIGKCSTCVTEVTECFKSGTICLSTSKVEVEMQTSRKMSQNCSYESVVLVKQWWCTVFEHFSDANSTEFDPDTKSPVVSTDVSPVCVLWAYFLC